MNSTAFARGTLALVGLLAFALWLPVAVITYVPGWHAASCDWHDRCNNYGREAALQRVDELRAYMQHRGTELPVVFWTPKERSHLAEVRGMLDKCAVIALLGAAVFFHANARDRARAAGLALLVAAACLVVLPFFGTFWREVFHPLLFDNQNWRTRPADTSYWIMPRLYFQYTTALVIGCAVLLCAALRLQARAAIRRQQQTGG